MEKKQKSKEEEKEESYEEKVKNFFAKKTKTEKIGKKKEEEKKQEKKEEVKKEEVKLFTKEEYDKFTEGTYKLYPSKFSTNRVLIIIDKDNKTVKNLTQDGEKFNMNIRTLTLEETVAQLIKDKWEYTKNDDKPITTTKQFSSEGDILKTKKKSLEESFETGDQSDDDNNNNKEFDDDGNKMEFE